MKRFVLVLAFPLVLSKYWVEAYTFGGTYEGASMVDGFCAWLSQRGEGGDVFFLDVQMIHFHRS